MIEPLEVQVWTVQPAGLDGIPAGETLERLVCSYFPPHTAFSEEALKQADERYLRILPANPEFEGTFDDKPFKTDRTVELTLDNGGALYLLAAPVDGECEARLWRLLPGREANQ